MFLVYRLEQAVYVVVFGFLYWTWPFDGPRHHSPVQIIQMLFTILGLAQKKLLSQCASNRMRANFVCAPAALCKNCIHCWIRNGSSGYLLRNSFVSKWDQTPVWILKGGIFWRTLFWVGVNKKCSISWPHNLGAVTRSLPYAKIQIVWKRCMIWETKFELHQILDW